ncbi:MAG: Gfo/Idh/MocA family protein [Bryobacteraceae bacterium]
MSDDRVGFGLLGAGLIAPFHARALRASSKTRLVAVADTNKERVDRLAAEFSCAAYSGLDEMLADPEIEAVSILTPNHLHREAVIRAVRAGKHILVEKPPAMSLREVDEMSAACNREGVKVGVMLQCRSRQSIQAIRAAILAGRFGKIYHADAYMKWFRSADYYHMDAWRASRRSGAGVTIQQAFHYIDLLQYLAGPIAKVRARMNNLAHAGVELEDTMLAFLDFESGAQGVVQASTALWPGTDIRIEINGGRGTAIVVGERMDTWKFQEERPEDEEIRRLGSAAVSTGATGAANLGYDDHKAVIEDMACAIRTGGNPMISLESARLTLECALAMYQSAKLQSTVTLPVRDEEDVW